MKRAAANKTRTPAEVRDEFKRKGLSVTAWALSHGYSPNLVHEVLSGRRKPTRGQTHRIAVMLGIKSGEIVSDVRKALEAV
jgi:gp16 family phage-associated protein